MKQNLIKDVVRDMLPYLNNAQIERLQAVMQHALFRYEVIENENKDSSVEQDFVELFLSFLQLILGLSVLLMEACFLI